MDDVWKRTLIRKYTELVDLVDMYVRACPDSLWEESVWPVTKDQPWVWPIKRFGEKSYPDEATQLALLPVISAYWNVAYHVAFHIDFYLSGGNLPYRPPAPFREEEHRPSTVPARTYTPEELLKYLEHCRKKARQVIGDLTDERATELLPRSGGTFADLLVHNLVHAHEHAGQFGLFLGQHGVVASESPAQQLRAGVRDRDDRELDHWVKAIGGYDALLPRVFAGFAASLGPRRDGTVIFDLGVPYRIRAGKGVAKFDKKTGTAGDVTVRMSRQDFLRMVTGDTPFEALAASGRVTVEGHPGALAELLASR